MFALSKRVLNLRMQRGFSSIKSPMAHKNEKYDEAVAALNELQCIQMMPLETKYEGHGLIAMQQFLDRINVTDDDMAKLNIIHVAGTKGKGSTCAFVESILRQHGTNTGFFSSPHLIEARERFRLNGKPLSRELFSKYFWEVYSLLDSSQDKFRIKLPSYFYFLAAMSFYVFKHEKVQAAIIEVGIGGTYDCTNVIKQPSVCGITSLGIDHINLLGDTISSIASHKAGIIKPGVPVFTVPQPENGLFVIEKEALNKKSPLTVAPDFDKYVSTLGREIILGLPGEHQKVNASLAIALADKWLQKHKHEERPNEYALNISHLQGLSSCQWNGRAQVIKFDSMTFYLDGAHTMRSIQCAQRWFEEQSKAEALKLCKPCTKLLIFNVTKKRDAASLLSILYPCGFSTAIFVPNIATLLQDELNDQNNLQCPIETRLNQVLTNRDGWKALCKANNMPITIHGAPVFPCIADAIKWISNERDEKLNALAQSLSLQNDSEVSPFQGEHIQILITGSLHLVGGCLRILKPDMND